VVAGVIVALLFLGFRAERCPERRPGTFRVLGVCFGADAQGGN